MAATEEPVVEQSIATAPAKPVRMTKDERAAAARARKDALHARKLHAIAVRRARAAKLEKAEFIAEIVKGNYRPITAEDIANEPDPE